MDGVSTSFNTQTETSLCCVFSGFEIEAEYQQCPECGTETVPAGACSGDRIGGDSCCPQVLASARPTAGGAPGTATSSGLTLPASPARSARVAVAANTGWPLDGQFGERPVAAVRDVAVSNHRWSQTSVAGKRSQKNVSCPVCVNLG